MSKPCILRIKGNPLPLAKLTIYEKNGRVRWTRLPLDAPGSFVDGKTETVGNNTKLIHDTGKYAGQQFGKLINFTLYNYNPKIIYTLASGDKFFKCEVLDDDGF